MTEKLYYKDSHMFSFDARVEECREDEKGYVVILDRTAFFPEGGGQLADTGLIGSAAVRDVQEIEGEIRHYTDSALEAGQLYHCQLDREQRLRRMQSHSGEHIVSGTAHRLYGLDNVGFHMGEECITIDLNGELTQEQIDEIERQTNLAIRADLPVVARFPEPEELKNINYRSKLELTHDVRIVSIEGVDCCACCAPHVARTGEIGVVKILDSLRHRGGMRLELLCGMDAYENYCRRQNSNTAISVMLSSKRDETAQAVERVIKERDSYKERVAALSMELIKHMAAEYEYTQGNICIFDSMLDEIALRELVNLLMEKCSGVAAAFRGSDGSGYRYIIGSANADMRKAGRDINAGIKGKGGGKGSMIQGSASESEANIRAFFEKFAI